MNQEKNSFILGALSAVSFVLLIGIIAISVLYINKDTGNSSLSKNNDVSGNENIKNDPGPANTGQGGTINFTITKDDHIRGNFDAPITIVEYSDFECPFCARFNLTMEQVMEKYPDDVRWVYRHFPLDSIHPMARSAAEASECAAEQGKFWEYHDGIFANQNRVSDSYLSELAQAVNLDTKKFNDCLSSDRYAEKVTKDLAQGQSYGVTGTPGNFINGQKLGGAVPFAQMESIIESLK